MARLGADVRDRFAESQIAEPWGLSNTSIMPLRIGIGGSLLDPVPLHDGIDLEEDQPLVRSQQDSRVALLLCEPPPVCVGDRRVGSAAGHQQADGPPIEDDEQRIGRRAHPQSDARRVLPQESDVVAADRDAGRTSE